MNATTTRSWWHVHFASVINSFLLNSRGSVTRPDGLHSPASKINGNVRGQEPGSAAAFQKSIRRIAVIGNGLTGASWATYYLAHGFDVIAADPAFDAADTLRRYVDSALGAVPGLETQTRGPRGSLRLTPNIDEALLRADFVQECSDGGPDSKIDLLAEIDKRTRPDSIIASNASGRTMKTAQAAARFPDRCVLARTRDLPHISPLIHIISTPATAAAAIKQAMSFYGSNGKLPIYAREEIAEKFTDCLQAMFPGEVRVRQQKIAGDAGVQRFASRFPHRTMVPVAARSRFSQSGARFVDSSACASRLPRRPIPPSADGRRGTLFTNPT